MAQYQNDLLNSVRTNDTMSQPRYPRYDSIEARQLTFHDRWSKQLPIHHLKLSMAGFFYTGISDRVICYHCGGGFHNLERDDKLADLHALLYGACKFLLHFLTKEKILAKISGTPTFAQLDKAFIPTKEDFVLLKRHNQLIENVQLKIKIDTLIRMHKREINITLTEANSCIREIFNSKKDLSKELEELKKLLECAICMSDRKDRILYCGHAFCHSCVNNSNNRCPLCRKRFSYARRFFW